VSGVSLNLLNCSQADLARFALGTSTALLSLACMASGAAASVTISSKATSNITCTSSVCTPSKKSAVLNVAQLESLLAAGNVKVTTDASDIVVSAALTWASGSSLTLDAYRSITIDEPVAVDGTGGLSLVTNDGGSGGALFFGAKGNVSFLSTSNNLTINGHAYTLVNDIATLATDIAANASGYYALAASYNAIQDGTYASSPVSATFNGTFEGLGNAISHLTIDATSVTEFGLFTEVGSGGRIENLGLRNVSITGEHASSEIGGLAFANNGTLFNDFFSGKIVVNGGGPILGGLVAINSGVISTCYAEGSVFASHSSGTTYVGGLVGANSGFPTAGSITNSYATGSVRARRYASAGGLVGFVYSGSISNSYAAASVTSGKQSFIGGLIGETNGVNVISSYATGAVSGVNAGFVGGLIGKSAATINYSYWDTTTSGITNLSQGAGNTSDDPGITGVSSTQLEAGLPADFDPTIWGENASINGGLPYLLAIPPT
jgi:hypothetical protein